MTRKPNDTKERILDTATNLFSTHGFDGTSVDDILTAVGITKGAFYHYFKSKDALCEAILEAAVAHYHELGQAFLDRPAGPRDLHDWLEVLMEKQSSGQWLYCRLITRLSIETAQLNSAMQNTLRSFWQWCQSLYETLIQRATVGTDRENDPAALARLFVAAHFGALWLDRCAPSIHDTTDVCETLLRQFTA